MAPNLIDMAPFLVEYAGLKYLTKFLIVRGNNANVVLWTHFYRESCMISNKVFGSKR